MPFEALAADASGTVQPCPEIGSTVLQGHQTSGRLLEAADIERERTPVLLEVDAEPCALRGTRFVSRSCDQRGANTSRPATLGNHRVQDEDMNSIVPDNVAEVLSITGPAGSNAPPPSRASSVTCNFRLEKADSRPEQWKPASTREDTRILGPPGLGHRQRDGPPTSSTAHQESSRSGRRTGNGCAPAVSTACECQSFRSSSK